MDRIRSFIDWVRRSPARSIVAGVAAVGAVLGGAAFAIALSNAGGRPTADAGVSQSQFATEGSQSPSAVPSSTPMSSPSPTASPTPTAAASQPATPTPTPTPETGIGGIPGPTYDVTGTWESLPTMPGGPQFLTADALFLPDGRIVVFRWDRGGEPNRDMLVYDPNADEWSVPRFDGELPTIGTDQAFALGSDGLVYSHEYMIDPTSDPWTVTPFQMVRESDIWAGTNLAADADGHIQRPADDTTSARTQLVAYDPATDTFERSSDVAGNFDTIVGGRDSLVLFGALDGDASAIEYAPATDAWSGPHPIPNGDLPFHHGAVAGDGEIYVPGLYPDAPELWRLSLNDDSWSYVEVPEDGYSGGVELLWEADGRLYAFGRDDAWVFTPNS